MIAILDYKFGNLTSVVNALTHLGIEHAITSNPGEIASADKIIFPGQGRAKPTMESLKTLNLDQVIRTTKKPFLGICIGMQVLLDFSEEDSVECLKIIPGRVRRFSDSGDLKVPQVGWNSVDLAASHLSTAPSSTPDPLLADIPTSSYFYFVNSYFADPFPEFILASTSYGEKFASIIKKDNFYGVQFHPEKSGEIGLKLLNNFCQEC